MLPNHSPLMIAEQFGTLESMYPGRIDLGLGRAPGSDQKTMMALRRTAASADRFPEDVLELQGYLTGETLIPGVHATPGRGTNVPLYILGSSMFGALLAASMGLPYAFASHFVPDALRDAVGAYRARFRPSAQLEHPYVIAGVNVIAATTTAQARQEFLAAKRSRAVSLFGQGRTLSDDEADAVLASPAGRHVEHMATYTAVGTPAEVARVHHRFCAARSGERTHGCPPFPDHRDPPSLGRVARGLDGEPRLIVRQLISLCVS